MFRKFEFHDQPYFDNGKIVHPDYEIKFSGVMAIDIEGNREVAQLYIGDKEMSAAPEYVKQGVPMSRDWREFQAWLHDRIVNADDSDKRQEEIKLPPGNMYDLFAPSKKPASNARQIPVPA